jgi:hypothetical protein
MLNELHLLVFTATTAICTFRYFTSGFLCLAQERKEHYIILGRFNDLLPFKNQQNSEVIAL